MVQDLWKIKKVKMRFLEKVLAMTYLAMCRIFLHIISQHHLAEANPASTPETNKPEQTGFFFYLHQNGHLQVLFWHREILAKLRCPILNWNRFDLPC